MDPRIHRTKKLLRDALIELMEEIGFERITIRDLTLKAGLNRGTFYLHYQDKYDLLEQSKQDLMYGMLEITGRYDHRAEEMISHQSTDEPYPILVEMFEYCVENADFLRTILGPKGDPSFPKQLKEFMVKHIYNKQKDYPVDELNMLVPPNYVTAYVISAHLGILQEWLEQDILLSPREIALAVTRLLLLGPKAVSGLK
jgi:AcrR family transcriptional regulator